MSNIEEKLNKIVAYLEDNFNQSSGNYNLIYGPRPQVIRFDKETAISTWACGAIVCIKHLLYFIGEDDGHWFCNKSKHDIGCQTGFSIGWVDSFVKALTDLQDYVKENGTSMRQIIDYDSQNNPIYGKICGYTLE